MGSFILLTRKQASGIEPILSDGILNLFAATTEAVELDLVGIDADLADEKRENLKLPLIPHPDRVRSHHPGAYCQTFEPYNLKGFDTTTAQINAFCLLLGHSTQSGRLPPHHAAAVGFSLLEDLDDPRGPGAKTCLVQIAERIGKGQVLTDLMNNSQCKKARVRAFCMNYYEEDPDVLLSSSKLDALNHCLLTLLGADPITDHTKLQGVINSTYAFTAVSDASHLWKYEEGWISGNPYEDGGEDVFFSTQMEAGLRAELKGLVEFDPILARIKTVSDTCSVGIKNLKKRAFLRNQVNSLKSRMGLSNHMPLNLDFKNPQWEVEQNSVKRIAAHTKERAENRTSTKAKRSMTFANSTVTAKSISFLRKFRVTQKTKDVIRSYLSEFSHDSIQELAARQLAARIGNKINEQTIARIQEMNALEADATPTYKPISDEKDGEPAEW
jgi:hypothetical protein